MRDKDLAWSCCSLFGKRFLIHYVRHFGEVTPVVLLEDIDQCLHAAARHSNVWIWRESGFDCAAGEVMEQPAAVLGVWVAQWGIRG